MITSMHILAATCATDTDYLSENAFEMLRRVVLSRLAWMLSVVLLVLLLGDSFLHSVAALNRCMSICLRDFSILLCV